MSTVRWVVLATIAVSLFHFTDNAVNVDTYPKAGWQPDWFEVLVVVGWFLYTAVGVAGYRLYRQGRYGAAHACLLIYGYLVAPGPPGERVPGAGDREVVGWAAGRMA